MKYNYQVGGRVLISGQWYEIVKANPDDRWMPVQVRVEVGPWVWNEFIQDYHAPTPPRFQWVTSEDFGDTWNDEQIVKRINQKLTEEHGDPTIRVYNGEPAEEFGLTPESWVLRWVKESWLGCWYNDLSIGQRWRKQLPAPKDGM